MVLSVRKHLIFTVLKCHTWTQEWYNVSEDKAMWLTLLFWWDDLDASYIQQNDSEVFSNDSLVHFCISFSSLCPCVHKTSEFWHSSIIYCSSMSKITIHKISSCCCMAVVFWFVLLLVLVLFVLLLFVCFSFLGGGGEYIIYAFE